MKLCFRVNGRDVAVETDAGRRLIDVLRDDLGLTGTKEGCGEGECGACTVLLDGRAVHACLTLAGQVQGKRVDTIEGLDAGGELDPLQTAFVEETAIQCGGCTSGMIMTAKALLARNPNPSDDDIRIALAGNICRCAGYSQIIRAVRRAAAVQAAGKTE
jgi:aerobic-type carbon monoxide dehydrogenase small subunit (CoxS/CutS family)